MSVEFSERQRDIILYVAKGFTQKEIARFLGISYRTVEAYMIRIREKTGVKSPRDVLVDALKSKMLSVDELEWP